jgi:hypothetical protein
MGFQMTDTAKQNPFKYPLSYELEGSGLYTIGYTQENSRDYSGVPSIVVATEIYEVEQAAFICKAVNCHEQILSVLKSIEIELRAFANSKACDENNFARDYPHQFKAWKQAKVAIAGVEAI